MPDFDEASVCSCCSKEARIYDKLACMQRMLFSFFFFFLSFFSLFAKDSRSAFADSIFYVDKENRACLSPVLLLLLLPSSLSSFSNTFERIIPFRNARRRLLSVLRSTQNEKEAKLTTSMIKAVVIPRYKVLTFVCST